VPPTFPQPVSPHDRAILHHPDRRTDWVQAVSMTLAEPVSGDPVALYDRRLARMHEEVPILGARLRGDTWLPGRPTPVQAVAGDPLDDPTLQRPLRLASEAPVRIVVGDGGRRVAAVSHHAALDGRGMVAVLAALQGAPVPPPAVAPARGHHRSEHRLDPLRRLLRPADPVAPSARRPEHDPMLVRTIALRGPHATAKLATACVAAVAARNARLGRPLRRVGISVGVGGPPGIGNVATYRRVDVTSLAAVRPAIIGALASPELPSEFAAPPGLLRLLSPIVDRFSDTVLVSNVGRMEVPGAVRLENFPVARGRSAVVFGSCGLPGQASTLSLRARDLDRADAQALLDDAVARLEAQEQAGPVADTAAPVAAGEVQRA
jgi:hypothetical protein